ncbi:unnamed protein product [Phaeothamnion confervicola]
MDTLPSAPTTMPALRPPTLPKANKLNATGGGNGDWRATAEAVSGRAMSLLEKALALDEHGADARPRAVDHYLEAAGEFLAAAALYGDAAAAGGTGDAASQHAAMRDKASQILDRVEEIKGRSKPPTGSAAGPKSPQPAANNPVTLPGAAAGTAGARAGAAQRRSTSSFGSNGSLGSNRGGGSPSGGSNGARSPSPLAAAAAAAGDLTTEEKEVLKRSSVVNGKLFLPWMDEDVNAERFAYPQPWTDPEGPLPLSAKQKQRLVAFKRPSMLAAAAAAVGEKSLVMIRSITPYNITQEVVTDCSFVASLCIASAFERRFRKQLITRIIYPQARARYSLCPFDARGIPRYNPSGKYMVRLWINGVVRKVVVDDFLPAGPHDRLLCSASADPTELWVSIIEKAYLKVNGGYDFPGSNSGIDLFALTGWLPEHILFEEHRDADSSGSGTATRRGRRDLRPLDNYQPAERVWQRLRSAHEFGDCLITVATDAMPEDEAERLGLVPSHAYAVLDVKEALGVRLLQVKNPWARVRWLGPYSVEDGGRWTPAMKAALGYDVDTARLQDNGVFWIDYSSVCKYFRCVFMNWNPALFSFRTVLHAAWPKEIGPRNDTYNLGHCPQFSLCVLYPAGPAAAAAKKGGSAAGMAGAALVAPVAAQTPTVWVLLSRHVTELEHDASSGDYMTLHVYAEEGGSGTVGDVGGRRIYYPDKPMYRGIYTNNPHTMVRFDLPPDDGTALTDEHGQRCRRFTLVVSQYEKRRDISFTLNVYCTATFRLGHTPPPPEHTLTLASSWDACNAGGGLGLPGFYKNPQFALGLATPNQRLHIEVAAPKDININVTLVRNGGARVEAVPVCQAAGPLEEEAALSSGSYRPGFCYVAVEPPAGLEAGTYTIVVSTYKAGECGAFLLKVASSAPLQFLRPVPAEGEGMARMSVTGRWSFADGSAAGCSNFKRYQDNPKYLFDAPEPCTLLLRLSVAEDSEGGSSSGGGIGGAIRAPINVAVFPYVAESLLGLEERMKPTSRLCLATSNSGVYTDSPGGTATPSVKLPVGSYVAVASTFEPLEAAFSLVFFSRPAITQPRRLDPP